MRFPFPPIEPARCDSDGTLPEVVETEASAAQHLASEALTFVEDSPPSGPETATIEPEPTTFECVAEHAVSSSTASVAEPEIPPTVSRRSRAKRKVIPFPRPDSAELSDPAAAEFPRILDLPQELTNAATTPLLDGLVFSSRQQQNSISTPDAVELPIRPAEFSRRICAGLIDCALIGAAFALFVAVSHVLLPKLTLTKPMLLAAIALAAGFWAVYQYLFLVYRTTTLGMHFAGVRLSTFKGSTPGRRQRFRRLLALYFSTASLMMGWMWAFVDADALCWHDRISQTYPVSVR